MHELENTAAVSINVYLLDCACVYVYLIIFICRNTMSCMQPRVISYIMYVRLLALRYWECQKVTHNYYQNS